MDFAAARKHLVDSQVRPNDVPDLVLQHAMESVAREDFVPQAAKLTAYVEKDISLFEGRWLLKARDFTKLIHAARISAHDLVLDIGCGLGYSTAILTHMAGMVVALEEDADIVADAEKRLAKAGRDNCAVVQGKLTEGKAGQGPYDVIIIAGGVEDVPQALLAQLKPGGRLATILVRDGLGRATVFTRNGEAFGHLTIFEASPAGIIPGFAKKLTFTF